MEKAIQIGKMLVFFSITFFFVMLGITIFKFRSIPNSINATLIATQGAMSNANATLGILNTMIGTANATLETVSRPCPTAHQFVPCGTLADIAKTLDPIRGAAGQIEIAAYHEDRQLGTLDQQERDLFSDVNQTLINTNKTVQDSDDLVKSPAITASLIDIEQTMQHVSIATDAAAKTAQDVQGAVHRYTNPPPKPWYTKIWNPVKFSGELIYDFMR